MKISLVILTYNRADVVKKAVSHNIANAGYPIHELIWVDNGSTDHLEEVAKEFKPDVFIKNKTNLGVSKGYNRGVVLATGTHIVITGCDRLMPDNWLASFVRYFNELPQTGIISCYSKELTEVPERVRGQKTETILGLPFIPAMPLEAKMFKREILRHVGHLREDLGLYGYEDLLWGERVESYCRDNNLIHYIIPNMKAEHIGSEGNYAYNGVDDKEYYEMKKREVNDSDKLNRIIQIRAQGNPYFNPYL